MRNGALRLLTCLSAAGLFACAAAPLAVVPRSPPAPSARPEPLPAATPSEPGAPFEPGAPADPGPPGLSFAVEPGDALVVIDGAARGAVSELPDGRFVPLQPGLYQVVLKRAGYTTWRAEVSVRLGTESIRVSLRRSP